MNWISIEDKLPDAEVDVFVRGRKNSTDLCHSVAGLFGEPEDLRWMSQETQVLGFAVTHWMPIPA